MTFVTALDTNNPKPKKMTRAERRVYVEENRKIAQS